MVAATLGHSWVKSFNDFYIQIFRWSERYQVLTFALVHLLDRYNLNRRSNVREVDFS